MWSWAQPIDPTYALTKKTGGPEATVICVCKILPDQQSTRMFMILTEYAAINAMSGGEPPF